jgi:putative YphP/YqiW family bacilliredoxin
MRYPEEMVTPMRQEMVRMGFTELRTPQDAKAAIEGSTGTVLTFVNSVCGCAGGIARPGIALALRHGTLPDKLTTVFAGMDLDATDYVRRLYPDYPPSSPQVALFKDGKPVAVIQRHEIEGTRPEHVAELLTAVFDRHCSATPRKTAAR